MKVRMTKPAQRRLNQIDDYYKEQGNKRHGTRLRKSIVKQSRLLSKHPEMGPEEPNLKHLGQGHRFILVEKLYKVVYLIAKPIIFITDVFDTRQDPDKMKG
jgi:plasmid stabilization system protein ParE